MPPFVRNVLVGAASIRLTPSGRYDGRRVAAQAQKQFPEDDDPIGRMFRQRRYGQFGWVFVQVFGLIAILLLALANHEATAIALALLLSVGQVGLQVISSRIENA